MLRRRDDRARPLLPLRQLGVGLTLALPRHRGE
jgi:hypothetical protein